MIGQSCIYRVDKLIKIVPTVAVLLSIRMILKSVRIS